MNNNLRIIIPFLSIVLSLISFKNFAQENSLPVIPEGYSVRGILKGKSQLAMVFKGEIPNDGLRKFGLKYWFKDTLAATYYLFVGELDSLLIGKKLKRNLSFITWAVALEDKSQKFSDILEMQTWYSDPEVIMDFKKFGVLAKEAVVTTYRTSYMIVYDLHLSEEEHFKISISIPEKFSTLSKSDVRLTRAWNFNSNRKINTIYYPIPGYASTGQIQFIDKEFYTKPISFLTKALGEAINKQEIYSVSGNEWRTEFAIYRD